MKLLDVLSDLLIDLRSYSLLRSLFLFDRYAGVYCASALLSVWNTDHTKCVFNATFDSPTSSGGVAGIGDAVAVLTIANTTVFTIEWTLTDTALCDKVTGNLEFHAVVLTL